MSPKRYVLFYSTVPERHTKTLNMPETCSFCYRKEQCKSLCEWNKVWLSRTQSFAQLTVSASLYLMHNVFVCVRVCVSGVTEYYCLSELNVKHGCVNGLRDRNNESSHQQAERPQLPPSSNTTSTEYLIHWLCHWQAQFTLRTLPRSLHSSCKWIFFGP